MKKEVKIIFHIDLNAFFATCAMIKEPYLKDKVFAIGRGHGTNRGIISTASYNARKYGIRSGMSVADAFKLYPNLRIVPSDYQLYKKYSNIFFKVLKNYSDIILEGSIDEAYLDMTESSKNKHPLALAKEIQDKLYNEYQLPVSIGIAPTLFLAKMASDMKKPLGITVIRKKDIVEKMFPLPIKDLFGIGKKTYPKLEGKGLKTIGDLMKKDNRNLVLSLIGKNAFDDIENSILGRSNDTINPDLYAIPKSISNETTLNYARDTFDLLLPIIKEQYDEVYRRLKNEGMKARTFGIKLKDSDFKSINRSKTIFEYTDDYDQIFSIIESIFESNYRDEPIRLVGVFVKELILISDLKEDFNLFTYQEFTKREKEYL